VKAGTGARASTDLDIARRAPPRSAEAKWVGRGPVPAGLGMKGSKTAAAAPRPGCRGGIVMAMATCGVAEADRRCRVAVSSIARRRSTRCSNNTWVIWSASNGNNGTRGIDAHGVELHVSGPVGDLPDQGPRRGR